MTRAKKTEGERIADTTYGMLREQTAAIIDRAIRRAQATAWTEGHLARLNNRGLCENPYRGRRR